MKNKRVLIIASFPPPVHGSAIISQYIKDSKCINDSFNCDFINLSISRRTDEIGKKNFYKIFRLLGAYLNTFYKLLFNKYDFCYVALTCHGIAFLKDAPFVLLCKLFRKKILLHQHNKGMSRDVDRWPYCWLLPLVYRDTKVILLSPHLFEDISKVVKYEQVMICPNGISEIVSMKNDDEHNNSIPRLLFLSNLIESKGVYILLDACKILKNRGLKFICEFVGGESKMITGHVFDSAVKERGLEENIIYLGPKYGVEKYKCFEHSDIFVFPTYYSNECFPLVNLEAMQFHLPIVTTNEGGIPDMILNGVNGFICERKNMVSLADAIEKLLDNKDLREEMGNNGYEKYKKDFTLEIFENRLKTIFQLMIDEREQ